MCEVTCKMMRRSVVLAVAFLGAAGAPAEGEQQPISLHQLAWQAHRDTPTSPDLIGARGETPVPLQPRTGTSYPCSTVFGYLPYWESSANLQYGRLTHIACFSVEVNSNGTLGNDHGWPWTALINTAHENGVKVVLVATLFDNAAINTLINNTTYKNAFFANLKSKMLEGTADGVNIDFEPGGSGSTSWQTQMHTFMAELTAYFHAQVPGSEVTIAGPAVNWSGNWNLLGIANGCDGIFIMGYAFWGSWSTTSGPNAPLTGGTYNITNTVLTQYGVVTQNCPEKLILGVPYYGHHWTTVSSAPRATVLDFISSTRFYNDEPNSQTYGVLWDATSQTPWYRWLDGSTWHQVWFDNATSLGLKYDLALDHGLQGVGMWALNYDGARTELWDLIAAKIGECYLVADFNGDGHVTWADIGPLLYCLRGPGVTYAAGHLCIAGDSDEDADVDLADFALVQRLFRP